MCIRDSSMTEPPLLTAVASATSNFNGFNVSCYGGNNGSGSVTPGGGVAPYTYLWTNNQTTQAANTLSVNTQYSVTVTDNNNCVVISNGISMTEPPLLTAVASATSNFNGFNVSCYGGNNGSGSVTPGGGVAPYTYLWTNNQTTQAANTLSVNTQYSVTVTDNNNCVVTSNGISMTEPPLLTAVASATSNFNGFNVSCYGGNNGSGSVTPGGGVAPYTYLWTNNQTTQAANTLSVNTQYSVTVTDDNN